MLGYHTAKGLAGAKPFAVWYPKISHS